MTRRNEGDVVLFDHIGYGYGWSDPLNEFDGSSPHWSIKFQKETIFMVYETLKSLSMRKNRNISTLRQHQYLLFVYLLKC